HSDADDRGQGERHRTPRGVGPGRHHVDGPEAPRPERLPDVEGVAVKAPGAGQQGIVLDSPEVQGTAATRQEAHGNRKRAQGGQPGLSGSGTAVPGNRGRRGLREKGAEGGEHGAEGAGRAAPAGPGGGDGGPPPGPPPGRAKVPEPASPPGRAPSRPGTPAPP